MEDPAMATWRERVRLHKLKELEGKCHQLWLYHGGETEEWNGDSCNCPWIQGNLVCERLKYEIDLPTNTGREGIPPVKARTDD